MVTHKWRNCAQWSSWLRDFVDTLVFRGQSLHQPSYVHVHIFFFLYIFTASYISKERTNKLTKIRLYAYLYTFTYLFIYLFTFRIRWYSWTSISAELHCSTWTDILEAPPCNDVVHIVNTLQSGQLRNRVQFQTGVKDFSVLLTVQAGSDSY